MNTVLWIILILLMGLFIFRILPPKGVKTINTTELRNMLHNKDLLFIDVRTPGEFAGRKIKQFNNIPLQQISSAGNKLNMNKEVVLICQSGMRSLQAARVLKKAGFEKVTNVKGGMNAWS